MSLGVCGPGSCAEDQDRVHTRVDRGGIRVKIGASLFVFAVGAILTFAVDWSPSGIDLATVGIILMIVGGILFLLSLTTPAPRTNGGEPIEPCGIVEERRIYTDDELP